MDELLDKLHSIDDDLASRNIDIIEHYYLRENVLMEFSTDYNTELLFMNLFTIKNDLQLNDKIVALYGISRYDMDKYEAQLNMKGDGSGESIDSFKSVIFNKIREIVLAGLEKAKELIKEKIEDLLKLASEKLAQLIKEQGIKLIEKVIEKIRNDGSYKSVYIKIDDEKQLLTDVLDKQDCKLLQSTAEDINDIYSSTYSDINKKVEKVKKGTQSHCCF